ncbi:hypothetical protein [Methylococcus capsulatus]|uniref:hypothetical protein n=1 Tax=Methylococcus capsulatus TaxID=414 RepID=UPI001C52F0B2|nr:hypothetical protein [Methylococcus capsulatus]QXP89632.1 hypothetical protein KW114_11035 [Methylococcus capsulatus]
MQPPEDVRVTLPPSIRWREVEVPRHEALSVPGYVVRIDLDRPGYRGVYGWQVCYPGAPRKFFSDTAGRGDRRIERHPRESLAEATEYLARIYQGRPSRLRRAESSRKKEPTGIVGVRRVRRFRRDRRTECCYVAIAPPRAGMKFKMLWVGTAKTATEERWAEVLERARVIRSRLVAEAKKDLNR